jgi:hypothetical protein
MTTWSAHHNGLYRMKCFSMLPPEEMTQNVDYADSYDVHYPPAGLQETDLSGKGRSLHSLALLSVSSHPNGNQNNHFEAVFHGGTFVECGSFELLLTFEKHFEKTFFLMHGGGFSS